MPTTLSSGVALTQVMIMFLFFLLLLLPYIPINFIYLVSSTWSAVSFYLSFITLLLQLAGGNSALALAMTVTSNLLGILIVSHK